MLRVAFLGTNYAGYQVQKNGNTVQNELNKATEALLGFPCDIVGCSRTDSGVHARDFCCTVTKKGESSLVTSLPAERFPRAICNLLPEDIGVFSAKWVEDDFHPRYDVKYKEYVYRIWNRAERDPFTVGQTSGERIVIDDEGFRRMQNAARDYVGTHDFTSFMAAGSTVSTTVRTVQYASVTRDGDMITFAVAADGFLYNMVRIMAGTLIDIAHGRIKEDAIPEILEKKNRAAAGFTAPPQGLCLNKVVY